MIRFDHIAIGAATLDQGLAYVEQRCGLLVPVGGKHPLMATHNRVMAVGSDVFFEIITTDPKVSAPDHKRWFGLDDKMVQNRLLARARPLAWVLNSNDLQRDMDIAAALGVNYGQPLTLKRGDLRWQFAVRNDGAIPLAGAAPMLMQWPDLAHHPAARMPDLGARITSVAVRTPFAEKLKAMLQAMGGDIKPVTVNQADNLQMSVTLALKSGQKVVLD